MSKWVSAIWSKVVKMKESIVQSFKNCGLSAPLMDHEMNNEAIPNYEMPKPFADESFRLIDDDNDNESNSKENNVKSDNNEFDFIYDEETLVAQQAKR